MCKEIGYRKLDKYWRYSGFLASLSLTYLCAYLVSSMTLFRAIFQVSQQISDYTKNLSVTPSAASCNPGLLAKGTYKSKVYSLSVIIVIFGVFFEYPIHMLSIPAHTYLCSRNKNISVVISIYGDCFEYVIHMFSIPMYTYLIFCNDKNNSCCFLLKSCQALVRYGIIQHANIRLQI